MQTKKLFTHQSLYIQAPFLYPDRRFHMLIAGYGAGKTSSNASKTEYVLRLLQGRRDKEGHRPRILVGGITLSHLEKTVLSYIKQDFDVSKTEYNHDKKHNILSVGDVDVILAPLQNPKEITGYDVWCLGSDSRIWCRKSLTKPKKTRIIDIEAGDEVLTRDGWKRVQQKIFRGIKETFQFGCIRITDDHKVLTDRGWVEASSVESTDRLLSVSKEGVWLVKEVERSARRVGRRLSSLEVLNTTGTRTRTDTTGETTSQAQTVKSCTGRCGKACMGQYKRGLTYTISTITLEIMRLKTLKLLAGLSTAVGITRRQEYTQAVPLLSYSEYVLAAVRRLLAEEKRSGVQAAKIKERQKGTEQRGTEACQSTTCASGAEKKESLSSEESSVLKNAQTLINMLTSKTTTGFITRAVSVQYAGKSSGRRKEVQRPHARHTVKISREDRRLEQVWDLTVEDKHEFFTESCLVHNCSILEEVDDLGLSAAEDTTFEAVKAVNERTRQVIPGLRSPFIAMGCFAASTEVLTEFGYVRIADIKEGMRVVTRQGLRAVTKAWKTGDRQTISFLGVDVTPEHRVWDGSKGWTPAKDIDNSSVLMVSSCEEAERWKRLASSTERVLGTLQSTITELATTGHTAKQNEADITEAIAVLEKALDYMWRYGKVQTGKYQPDMIYTMQTVTQVIIGSRILCSYQKKNTTGTTATIDTTSTSVRSVAHSAPRNRAHRRCAERASRKREEKKTESVQQQSEQERMLLCVKSLQESIGALIADRCSHPEVNGLSDVLHAQESGRTSSHVFGRREKEVKKALRGMRASVRYAAKSLLPEGRLYTVHKNASTGISLLEAIIRTTPTRRKRYVTAAIRSGQWHATKGLSAQTVPVYDLEVEHAHEFFVKTAAGDVLVHNSTSQGQKGLYRLYTQFKKAGTGFTLVRGRTSDNTSLDPEYVQSLYEIYDETEREVFLEGKFLALSKGQVFGSFDWNRNYIDYDMDKSVGANETLYWGQDFNQGYHRGCVGVLRNGTVYIIKRYEFPEIMYAPKVVRSDFPTQKIFFLPDTTAKDEVTHFARELRRNDIRLILRSRNPIVEDSAFLVNKMLYTKRLIIARSARETAEKLSLAQRDARGMIPKGVGPSSPIHDTDAVRFICFFLACNRPELARIKAVTIERHLHIYEEDNKLSEMSDGFYEIDASGL